MFKAERQDEILRILKERQHTTVELLAQELFASPATVRRDIQALEKEGLVIARRTIAKYRDMLKIPPASLRKSL